MKKFIFLSYIFMLLTAISFSNTAVADFSLIDSDGDAYHVGSFLGYERHNQKYYVKYDAATPFPLIGEGILYYDDLYQSLKIVMFENNDLFGFTIEGYWDGSGSTIYYVNTRGDTGTMNLFLSNHLPRKRLTTTRVKQVSKHNTPTILVR